MIVSLTAHDAPPRVDVSISDLPIGTTDVEITRIVEGVNWSVRQAGVIIAGSGAYTEDHEAPTGVALFYRVVASGSDGGLLAEAQESVPALADAPHSMVWLSDPLTAASAVLVTLYDNGAGGSYDIDARSSFPRGSRLAHTSYGTRQASPRSPLIVINSEDDYTTVMSLLSGPVLIRPPRHLLWGPAIYGIPVGLGDSVDPHAPEGFDAEISFTVTPSRGPGVDVLVPRRTWGDVLAEAPTWAALNAAWPAPNPSLISNGGFRENINGWYVEAGGAAPTWVAPGHYQVVGSGFGINSVLLPETSPYPWATTAGTILYIRARLRKTSGQTPTGTAVRVVFGATTVNADQAGWSPDGDGWHSVATSVTVPAGFVSGTNCQLHVGVQLPAVESAADVLQLDDVIVSASDVPFSSGPGPYLSWRDVLRGQE